MWTSNLEKSNRRFKQGKVRLSTSRSFGRNKLAFSLKSYSDFNSLWVWNSISFAAITDDSSVLKKKKASMQCDAIMGQVTKVRLSCYLVLLSSDSETRVTRQPHLRDLTHIEVNFLNDSHSLDTQNLARGGKITSKIWGVFCEFKVSSIFWLCHCNGVCIIILYCTIFQQHPTVCHTI